MRWGLGLGPEPGPRPGPQPGPGPGPGPGPEAGGGQPIAIALLGSLAPRHKGMAAILVELPLASRLLSVPVCAQSYSSNSRPRRQQDRTPRRRPHHHSVLRTCAIHAPTWADLPSMPLTLPLTKPPAACLPLCHSSLGSRAYCAVAWAGRHATPPVSGTRECLISSHIPSHPSHPHPSPPTLSHSRARVSPHRTCRLVRASWPATRGGEIESDGKLTTQRKKNTTPSLWNAPSCSWLDRTLACTLAGLAALAYFTGYFRAACWAVAQPSCSTSKAVLASSWER